MAKLARLRRDFYFVYGEIFEATVRLYEDPRLRRWRGTYKDFFGYIPGDGVEWEGVPAGSSVRPSGPVTTTYPPQAYIALFSVKHVVPGSAGSASAWSKMTPPDLTGANIEFTIEGVYTYKPAVSEGIVSLSITPSHFATAPSSVPCFLKVTDMLGNPTYPAVGSALFKNP